MRIYLVGAGVISRAHAKALSKLLPTGEVTLKVADPSEKNLAEFRATFPTAIGYNDATAMLAEAPRETDVVIVATPPVTHYELALQGLRSGRHVLCEKPLVMNREQAAQLLTEANARGLQLGCCSNRYLGSAKLEEVKRLVRGGELGDLYKVTCIHRRERNRTGIEYQPESRWFLDRSRNGGGVLFDWGPYDFATLNDILLPTEVVVLAAWSSRPLTEIDPVDCVNDVEQHVGAMLRYRLADGRDVAIHYERCSLTHGKPYLMTEIEGTKGAVRWDTFHQGDEVTRCFDREGCRVEETATFSDAVTNNPSDNPLRYLLGNLAEGCPYAIVNEQAVFNFECMLAIYACVQSGERQRVTRREKGARDAD